MSAVEEGGTIRVPNDGGAGPQFSALLIQGTRLSYCFAAHNVCAMAEFTREQLHQIARTVQRGRAIRLRGFCFDPQGEWLSITHDDHAGNVALNEAGTRRLFRMLSHADDDPEGR